MTALYEVIFVISLAAVICSLAYLITKKKTRKWAHTIPKIHTWREEPLSVATQENFLTDIFASRKHLLSIFSDQADNARTTMSKPPISIYTIGSLFNTRYYVVITDADAAKQILALRKKQANPQATLAPASPRANAQPHNTPAPTYHPHLPSLMFDNGRSWRLARKLLEPLFSPLSMSRYHEIMQLEVKGLIRALRAMSTVSPNGMIEAINRCWLSILITTVFGRKLERDVEEAAITTASTAVLRSIQIKPIEKLVLGKSHSAGDTKLRRALKQLVKVYLKDAKQRRDMDDDSDDGVTGLYGPLSEKMDEKRLISEVVNIFLNGYIPVSEAILNSIYQLSTHATILDRAQKEMDAVLGPKRKVPSVADLSECELVKGILNEAIRLFPPVPVATRTLPHDLYVLDHKLPKGTDVVISFEDIFRDERYFEFPNEFVPERWLRNHEMTNRTWQAFTPFSLGPRNCIGQNLAKQSSLLILTALIKNFEWGANKAEHYVHHSRFSESSKHILIHARRNGGDPVQAQPMNNTLSKSQKLNQSSRSVS